MILLLLTLVILCGINMSRALKSYNGYKEDIFNKNMCELKIKEEERERKERLEREERERKFMLEKEERERKERLEREERERNFMLEKEEKERKERLEREEKEREFKEKLFEKDNFYSLKKEELAKGERVNLKEYTDNFRLSHIEKPLTFDEVMNTINILISRVWSHEEHFYLKANDITIPKIEEETQKFTVLVLTSMSKELQRHCLLYLSLEGLTYYIKATFNDFIWKYATDRNELQGLYKLLYSNNREQLKRELAQMRKDVKTDRLKKYGKDQDDIGSGSNNFY